MPKNNDPYQPLVTTADCKTVEIYGKNYAGYSDRLRNASRAVIVKDGKILLSHETNTDLWGIPGGGAEGDETPEACCIREVEEEAGLVAAPRFCFLVVKEYYRNWAYVTCYFVCDNAGSTDRRPTEREAQVGEVPEWIPFEEALEIFSRHEEEDRADEMCRGYYKRDHTALVEYARIRR